MKRITIYMNEQVWHDFRQQCLEQQMSASQRISQLIAQDLTNMVSAPQEDRQAYSTFSVRIPVEILGAIRAYAAEQKRSANSQIADILTEWVAQHV